MKHIIFILFIFVSSTVISQTKGYVLEGSDGFITGSLQEPNDRHWFNTNLSANANHTHDANNKISTVNELGGWNLVSGIVTQASMQLDSSGIAFNAPDLTIDATDDLALRGGPSNVSLISLFDDGLTIKNNDGNTYITTLNRDNAETDIVGIDETTGKIVLKDASIHPEGTPASATAPGTTGMIKWDANFIYVCIANNVWKRAPISTW